MAPVISYAHMGTSIIPIKFLLSRLGHEVLVPPRPSRHTLSLGTRHSPEFACIPFKLVLGTYLEVLSKGVDILISGGGLGPCRAGYYGVMHKQILQALGYDPEIIFFWPPLKKPLDFIRKIKRLKGRNSWRTVITIIKETMHLIDAIDEVEKLCHHVRSLEINKGETSRTFDRALTLFSTITSASEIEDIRATAISELNSIPIDPDRRTLQIGIIGEIYVQLEPFANFFLEQFLGERGVQTERSIFLSHYARSDIFRSEHHSAVDLAQPYLPQQIGGHGQNSVGDVVRYAKEGFDGVIQLAPFTCIPEIVAKSILPHLSQKLGIPVLTMFIDEQTGLAGVETRLEAFIDLLQQRKARQEALPGLT